MYLLILEHSRTFYSILEYSVSCRHMLPVSPSCSKRGAHCHYSCEPKPSRGTPQAGDGCAAAFQPTPSLAASVLHTWGCPRSRTGLAQDLCLFPLEHTELEKLGREWLRKAGEPLGSPGQTWQFQLLLESQALRRRNRGFPGDSSCGLVTGVLCSPAATASCPDSLLVRGPLRAWLPPLAALSHTGLGARPTECKGFCSFCTLFLLSPHLLADTAAASQPQGWGHGEGGLAGTAPRATG